MTGVGMRKMANGPDPAREEPRTGVPIVSCEIEKSAVDWNVDIMADRIRR